jgi:hypothetical protein
VTVYIVCEVPLRISRKKKGESSSPAKDTRACTFAEDVETGSDSKLRGLRGNKNVEAP